MRADAWLHSWSLRGRLSAVALAGLTTTIVLTVLLLMTAWSASGVVTTARTTHERVRVYSQLQDAARDYQRDSYQGVRERGLEAQRKVVESRTRLENLLAEAARLPAKDERERAVGDLIATQGAALVDHFRNAPMFVAAVDRVWQEQGSRAAMREINGFTQPIYAFRDTLNGEIRRGDWTVANATRDAQVLIKTAVSAAFVGLVFALMFSLAVQYLLHMRLRPALRRLEDGARAFGEGNLDHRVGLDGHDELTGLSRVFDAMAGTIAEKQEALRKARCDLELAVTQRTEELQAANAKLAAADERRRAFLADVSHELRTPLTIIRGEAQVALRTADAPDFMAQEPFERILQQTHDLSRMVDDLLLIALAESGHLPLDLQLLDLRELGARLSADFEILAGENGGSIRSVAGPPVFAAIDRDRMRRALAALIENAFRHCPGGVAVTVEARGGEDGVTIAVGDDGPGLDFAHADSLFERFRRGETRGEGSGLGLSLVHALVQAHGGTVKLGPRPGGGTVATLHFPQAASHQEAA